jgi:hypothetical protein
LIICLLRENDIHKLLYGFFSAFLVPFLIFREDRQIFFYNFVFFSPNKRKPQRGVGGLKSQSPIMFGTFFSTTILNSPGFETITLLQCLIKMFDKETCTWLYIPRLASILLSSRWKPRSNKCIIVAYRSTNGIRGRYTVIMYCQQFARERKNAENIKHIFFDWQLIPGKCELSNVKDFQTCFALADCCLRFIWESRYMHCKNKRLLVFLCV